MTTAQSAALAFRSLQAAMAAVELARIFHPFQQSDLEREQPAEGAGLGLTIALIYMRREHLVSTLASALLSGFVGSLIMWFVGTRLGSVDISGLSGTEEVTIDAPLQLTLPAMIMIWPLTAAVVVSIVAAADWFSAARKRNHADDTFSI